MRIKSLLILMFSLLSLAAFAQTGGVKGRIVSRMNRVPVSDVTVKTIPATTSAISDENGQFTLEAIDSKRYMVEFTANGYETLVVSVQVEDSVKDLYTLVMTPEMETTVVDDSIFGEFDTDSANDAMSIPSNLSSYKDLFSNIAAYKFSEIRFAPRGYDSQYSDVYLNGIRMNDALTGYSPWSLWSGLNDATRNQETTSGMGSFAYGVGGLNGSTNILARASHVRRGWSTSVVGSNLMYRFRAMATYASGMKDNGWAYAFSLSTRQGGNDFVDGIYYNTIGYFGSLEKLVNDRHLFSLTVLAAPTERGAQQASTQEVYDLVGSNYYNPNWGYQDGKMRNTRVKEYHEPITMFNYNFKINDRSELNAAASYRFGQNGYSSLTWFSGSDPRPDYYRNLPSYDRCPNPAWVAEAWLANTDNIRHMDFDAMYNVNYNGEENSLYGEGHRANYMIEERHTDQRDFNAALQYNLTLRNNSQLFAGLTARRNRTEYYSSVKDLLGGDYWVDIDKFAERDFGTDELAYQNNLDYYNKNGHAEAVREGDKYSYDYYAHVQNYNLWATYNFVFGFAPNLSASLSAEVGATSMWREGLWKKGLFPTNSQGDSRKLNFKNYKGKANIGYRFNRAITIEANAALMNNAPTFQSAFVSPRTRNDVTPGLHDEDILSFDGVFNINTNALKFRFAGYYTTVENQTKVISFYNDLYSSFDNFAMSGIDKHYAGIEAAISVPLVAGISANSALSFGKYTYDSNPEYVEIVDNSATPLSKGTVYWEDFHVEGTPQTALNLGLSYRSPDYLFASIDCNYYDRLYLSMNPLYRTDNVLTSTMSAEDIAAMRSQERMDPAFTLNASIGKSWYINREYNLGVSLELKNILNNQNIKTGGYEQMRLNEIQSEAGDVVGYSRFDSKYFYMLGRTYYLNVYLRF